MKSTKIFTFFEKYFDYSRKKCNFAPCLEQVYKFENKKLDTNVESLSNHWQEGTDRL